MRAHHQRIEHNRENAAIAPGARRLFLNVHSCREALGQRIIHRQSADRRPVRRKRDLVEQTPRRFLARNGHGRVTRFNHAGGLFIDFNIADSVDIAGICHGWQGCHAGEEYRGAKQTNHGQRPPCQPSL